MHSELKTGIVLNIFEKPNQAALVKVLLPQAIIFVYVKSFFKKHNKNRANIFIGAKVQFEILLKYSQTGQEFLKKAQLLNYIDLSQPINQHFLPKLFNVLQKIEQPKIALYQFYENFLVNWKTDQLAWFITFLFNQILIANSKILHLTNCLVCKTNQQLFAFNWYEGGMFCFHHYPKNNAYNQLNLKFLKAVYALGTNLRDYFNQCNAALNEQVFQMLLAFDKYY